LEQYVQSKPKQVLRIAIVDNFQGEEAKVVIISLVQSNTIKSVGFLKTTNWINVLLSRAKDGMYIIGNADTYAHVLM
jgi:superfamily I DNA and/or RNA helicase